MATTHNAVARLGVAVNYGEGYWATRCAGTITSGVGRLLTSLRRPWMAHDDETAATAGLQRRR
jgi:hypothetical protein